MQSFCYDALNRLVWAGNTGTPTGGDHCGTTPTGTTTPTYQQAYSYDAIDRLTSGPSGAMTYDPTHVHAAITLGQVPNQYASYDAMGNMTCRNVDTTTTHSCDATQSGAIMSYDNEGRLDTWSSPTLTGATMGDQFLYDNAGNRVLQRATVTTSGSTSATDTIYFDGYTETAINGGTSSTIKYYSANGQKLAMKQGSTLTYLVSDLLGNSTLALKSDGTLFSAQLFSPFGSVRYSDSTMPNSFSFTGQRLDSQTGLLYYNFRYYDPVSGRFTRTDTKETNAVGMDTYGYVHGNPETICDPTGHWGWDTVTSAWNTVKGDVPAITAGECGTFVGSALLASVVVVLVIATAPVSGPLLAAAAITAGVAALWAGEQGGNLAFGTAILSDNIAGNKTSTGDAFGTGFFGAVTSGLSTLPKALNLVGTAAKNFGRATKAAGVLLSAGRAIVKKVSHQASNSSNQGGSRYHPYIPPYERNTNTWDDTVDTSYYRAVNSGSLQGSTAAQNSWHQQANWSFLNQRRAFFGV